MLDENQPVLTETDHTSVKPRISFKARITLSK